MNQQFTSEVELFPSVTRGTRHHLKPTDNSPSLDLRNPVPGVNFVSPQIFNNTLSWEKVSVAEVPGEGSEPTDYLKLQEAKRYFQENKAQILERYRGDFIAILNNAVLDHDRSFSELAKRVYEKFGYQTIYMPLVESEPAVLRIPSPRIGKRRVDGLRKEV